MDCPCGLPGPYRSKGATVASWLDRSEDATVRVRRRLPRFECRCGRTWTHGAPDLAGRYRMTNAVVEAIFEDSLDMSFVNAAKAHGTSRTTVASVFAERSTSILESVLDAPTPLVIVAREEGVRTYLLACDGGDPRVVDAYVGFSDPRLALLLGRGPGRVCTDWNAGSGINARFPDVDVTIHRSACLAMIWSAMPSCVRNLKDTLSASGRRALAAVQDLIVATPLSLSISRARAVEDACRIEPSIRRFVSARDALVSVFGNDGPERAERAFSSWDRYGMKPVMRPALNGLTRLGDAIFNAGYGDVSKGDWDAVARLSIPFVSGEPALKRVVRHLVRVRRSDMALTTGFRGRDSGP